MLLWGAGQPFSGALADRFGAPRVLAVRRAALHRRHRLDGVRADAVRALHVGRRADRAWASPAARSRIVIGAFAKLMPPQWRTIAFGAGTAAGSFGQFLFSPLAVGLIDGIGWQQHAAGLRRHHADHGAAGVRHVGAARRRRLRPWRRPRTRRSARRWPRRSATRAIVLLIARLLHLRLSALLHHRASAGLPGRSRPAGLDRRLDHRGDRAVQHRGLARLGLHLQPDAQALSAVGDLFQPFARHHGVHPAAAEPGGDADFRRGHRRALALHHSADLGAGGDHVRPALADHAARRCLLQPSDRRLPRRLARRRAVRAHRLLRRGLVGRDLLRRRLGRHQPADRRAAGVAAPPAAPAAA